MTRKGVKKGWLGKGLSKNQEVRDKQRTEVDFIHPYMTFIFEFYKKRVKSGLEKEGLKKG